MENKFTQGARAIVKNFYEHIVQIEKRLASKVTRVVLGALLNGVHLTSRKSYFSISQRSTLIFLYNHCHSSVKVIYEHLFKHVSSLAKSMQTIISRYKLQYLIRHSNDIFGINVL